ncbi:ThiF family adenylyltransferase [uncultured Mailhella sp.]|uniref:ThiF family adenylyltransferase n=1 Tax=uncultured Mailhella sp. TaxID=1981031 RepID=UPI0025CEEF27|nr:ThiF family adenylyltransferase [uncultured Mailhella sp.]
MLLNYRLIFRIVTRPFILFSQEYTMSFIPTPDDFTRPSSHPEHPTEENTMPRSETCSAEQSALCENRSEIRFPHGLLRVLRESLLNGSREECFALLLARREESPSGKIVFVADEIQLPGEDDIESSGRFHIRPSRSFIASVLAEVQARPDVDCIVDVHTHPFTPRGVFSSTDNADEESFCRCLSEEVDSSIHYASIVFGTETCSARLWRMEEGLPVSTPALVKAQTAPEAVPCEGFLADISPSGMLARSELALGVDVLRRMASDQLIVLAGAGGIGSLLAEMLVRSGFTRIGLIDNDALEITNLNRFAGGYLEDVGKPKVQVIRHHLERIRPDVEVSALQCGVESPEAESLMAAADWVLLSTDSHSSRHVVQRTCRKYAVPLISAGVNISVEHAEDGRPVITDQSGEVIVIRHGDGFCLHCLGRISPIRMAAEQHPDPEVREGLVRRGYVSGLDVKEPAVMPLNAVVAAQAVQELIDQYRDGTPSVPVTVYESHAGGRMYADWESMAALPAHCFCCGRDVAEEAPLPEGENAGVPAPEAEEHAGSCSAEECSDGEEAAPEGAPLPQGDAGNRESA